LTRKGEGEGGERGGGGGGEEREEKVNNKREEEEDNKCGCVRLYIYEPSLKFVH